MQLLDATIAFAFTIAAFASVVSIIVEIIHQAQVKSKKTKTRIINQRRPE